MLLANFAFFFFPHFLIVPLSPPMDVLKCLFPHVFYPSLPQLYGLVCFSSVSQHSFSFCHLFCLASSSSWVSLVFINCVCLLFPLSCDFLSVPVSLLRHAPQLGPIRTMWCQFWGPLSFHHLHLGAYPVLSSPPQAPGQAAKPPAAPYPPAPARPQRPPSHLPESGPTAHWAWGWGPPGGPAGGAW